MHCARRRQHFRRCWVSMAMSEAFVERLSRRYSEVYKAKGAAAATQWFKDFVPKEEQPRVFKAVKEGRKR